MDGIFRFIIKLGMNPVLDGPTRALKFIHYRDETNEPGFLFPHVGVCLDGIFRFIIKLGMNQVLDGQTTAQRQGETFRIGKLYFKLRPGVNVSHPVRPSTRFASVRVRV